MNPSGRSSRVSSAPAFGPLPGRFPLPLDAWSAPEPLAPEPVQVGFNFADNYRAAGLTVSPEVLRARQAPFDKLRKELTPQIAADLVRLYYDLKVPRGTDWFRDAFGGEADPSFSMIDNAREAAVLSAGLLEAAAEDGKVYAILGVLTGSAAGIRQPAVRPDLPGLMGTALERQANSLINLSAGDPSAIKNPVPSKITAELTNLVNAPDLTPAVTLLKQVSEEGVERTKTLTGQVYAVVRPLVAKVVNLEEKIEMLSWHIGGWSRLLDTPFAEFEIGPVALLAGLDMADMSRSTTGPVSARALLQRTIGAGRKARAGKVSLKDAVDALDLEAIGRLDLATTLQYFPDICPILNALARALDVGAGPAWHASFVRDSHLEADIALSPLDLALQTYRERLLIRPVVRSPRPAAVRRGTPLYRHVRTSAQKMKKRR